jgi:hypothetical protein
MGYTSLKNIEGEKLRIDFSKYYSGTTLAAARWFDLSYWTGSGSYATILGTYVKNGDFQGTADPWTFSAGFAWTAATHLMTKSNTGNSETLSQNTTCVNGTSYVVIYTIGSYAGSGNVTISLGGTNGTGRTANGTYTETISCGATANAPLVVTVASTVTAVTIDVVSVRQELAFTPCSETSEQALWHGGNVSPATKHILEAGVLGSAAATVPGALMIVDILGVYPRIRTDLNTTQTLINTQTLPRYTDGKGVMSYYCTDVTNGANAQNFIMTYTNSASVSGRTLGSTVANTASSIQSQIAHAGIATNNTGGPFLPLYMNDAGVKSVQSVQFSAASASAGFVNLVLCRPLVMLPIYALAVAHERNLITTLPSMPKIEDGACLGFLAYSTAIATGVYWKGYLNIGWA